MNQLKIIDTVNLKKVWHVASFTNGDLGIVPYNWLHEDKKTVSWPKVNRYRLGTLTEECAQVKKTWQVYTVKKFHHRNVDKFPQAVALFNEVDSEISGTDTENNNNILNKDPPTRPVLPTAPTHSPGLGASDVTQAEKPPSNHSSSKKRKSTSDVQSSAEAEPSISKKANEPSKTSPNSVKISASQSAEKGPSTEGDQTLLAGTSATNNGSMNSTISLLEKESAENPVVVQSTSGENDAQGMKISPQLIKQLIQSNLIVAMRGGNQASNQQINGAPAAVMNPATAVIPDTEPPPALLSLCPFGTVEEFKKFDRKLKKSKSARNKLRDEYQAHWMSDRRACCRKLVEITVGEKVACHYTFAGQNSKRMRHPKGKFKKTQVHALILESVNAKFPNHKVTKEEFKKFVADWFAQAPFNLQKKANRAELRRERRAQLGLDPDLGSSASSQSDTDADSDGGNE